MQALVGQALIEIRATWEGVAADTRAALAEVEGQIAATEARIGASVGGTVAEVEASSKAMAAAVKTATDEVGIAWVSASQAGTEFAVSQSEIRSGIRGATIDAQSLAASTDGLIAGFLGASQAGQVFTTTEAGMRAEMRAVAADADEAFATMFTGFATGSQQLEAQITAAITAEKALGAAAVEAASEVQILDGAASSDAATVARLGTAMEGTAASVKRVTIASAEYADELVALIERDEALGMAVGQLMARYEGLDIKTAEHIVQNRGVAASSQAVTDALAAEIVAVQGLTKETTARSRSLTALGTAIDLAAKQEQGLINVTAARARALGVASLTESEAAQVSNAYTVALERQFLATGRTANVSGAMKAALASMNPEVDKSASSSTKAAAAQMGFGDEVENAAVKFNFLTRTIRNSLFIITGLEAATAALTIKMAEEQNKLLNLSQQFGIASAEISGFSLLSKATGESIDTINTSLRMMQKGFAGVGDGSNLAQQAFAALGIQTAKTGATARDTSTIFKQVADVMSLIPDGEQKISIGNAIMGRSFNAVIPVINQGSAAFERMKQASKELGTEMTTLDLLTGHAVVTAWTDFKGAIQGVGFAIERELAPSMLSAITSTTQWIAVNRELLASNIAGFMIGVGNAFRTAMDGIDLARSSLVQIRGVIEGLVGELPSLGTALENALRISGLGIVIDGFREASQNIHLFGEEQKKAAAEAVDGAKKLDDLGKAINSANEPTKEQLDLYVEGKSALEELMAKYPAAARAVDEYRSSTAKGASTTSVLTAESIKASTELGALQVAFRNLNAGMKLTDPKEIEAVNNVLKATDLDVQALEKQFKAKKLSADASTALAKALGVEEKSLLAAVNAGGALVDSNDKAARSAAQAAAQVDKFNASAAKATAQEMATQVNSLANELSRLSLPEAIERLPALLNLNAQALDAEVAAIRAETETKLGAAKTEEARNAALAEEADRVQKATVANELHAQKLVDTVTHTESAAKITEEYTKTIRGLQEAQDALKITVIDDQIKAITDSWKNLDIATRQSQLPQVLDLIAQKYDILAAKETAESEAKIANARATYDSAEAAYALTGSQEDLASMVAALNALWDVTDAVQANAALSAEDLAFKMNAEAQAARDAANQIGSLSNIASDFAKSIASGNWDKVGESIIASIIDATFTDHLENALNKTVVKSIKSLTDPVGKAMETVFESVFDGLITSTGIKSALQSLGNSIVSGLSSIIGSSGGEVAKAVEGATNNSEVLSKALQSGGAAGGSAVSGITGALGAAGAVAGIGAAAFGLFQVMASVFGGPSAKELMARRIKETLSDALTSDEVVSALNEAAAELGFGFSESMVGAIAGINTSITKTISAHIPIQIYPDIFFNKDEFNADVQALVADTGITEEFASQILSGGPVIGGAEGFFQLLFGIGPDQINKETSRYLGDIAAAAGIAAADIEKVFGKERNATIESFGAGLANLGYQLGLTAEETQQMIEEFNTAIGAPQAAVLAFRELDDELRAELGTGDQYQSMMQSVTDRLRGLGVDIPKRVKSLGDLRDAFLQAGMPADQFAKLVKAAMEDAGISVDQFGDDWASITAALVDPQVQGIDEVIADVQRLGGLSPLMDDLSTNFQDMFDAFAPGGFDSSELTVIGEQLSKLATLPPDALAGMSGQLHDMFVEIARANDLTLPQVAEMFRGKIPDSVLQSVMAVQSFGQELGLLSGESNTSLREVEDDFRRLAGEVLDSSGELTAFGETLNKQLQAGISGLDQAIADEMGSAGQVSADTTAQVMYQLAELMKLPPEQLSDSTKQAIDQLKADLMAALNLTSEQVDAMIAQAASAPPPVPTGTTEALDDATASTDSLTTSTTDAATATGDLSTSLQDLGTQATALASSGGPSVTESLGLTPEAAAAVADITAGLSTAASGATEMATAVQQVTESVSGSTDEFAALAKAAGMSSEQVRAAIQPIIGAEDDGQSLVATQAALSSITTFLPEEMVPSFQDAFDSANASVSSTFTKVGELQSALTALAKNHDITITTHYVTDGAPDGACHCGPEMASGGIIPGSIGSPYPITAHGQELVVPASTATTLPPSLVDALLSGTAFRMPADFAPRLSPVAVGNTDPAQSATAPDPDFVAVRMSKADAAAAMYAPLMVMVERDSRNGMVRFKDGKAKIHPHLRARARRG